MHCLQNIAPINQNDPFVVQLVTAFSKKESGLEGSHPHLLNPQHPKAARNLPAGYR